MAVDLFGVADAIHEKLPELRFTSGRWAIYNSPLDDSLGCVLYKDFIDCVRQLRREEGLSSLATIITSGEKARQLEELLRGICDDDSFHSWGLSFIALNAKARFDKGERKNEPPVLFKGLSAKDFILLDRIVFHSYDNHKFFIISGKAGSGKSSFLNLLIQMLDNDFSAIENAKGSSYDLDQVVARRIAYADDVCGELPIDAGSIKSIVTHGNLAVDPKLKTKYTIKYPQTTIVFLSNEKPKVNIGDSGILRRICWYKKSKTIEKPDERFLTAHYSEDELEDLALFLLSYEEWLKSDSGSFDWFKYFEEDTKEMASICSTVYKFYKSMSVYELSAKFDYPHYRDFCKDNGYHSMNASNFLDQTSTLIDWGRIDKNAIGQVEGVL